MQYKITEDMVLEIFGNCYPIYMETSWAKDIKNLKDNFPETILTPAEHSELESCIKQAREIENNRFRDDGYDMGVSEEDNKIIKVLLFRALSIIGIKEGK